MSNPKKKGILSFQNFTDKQSQNYLADHFPKGKLTIKRFTEDTVIYKFILSMSLFIKIFVGDLLTLAINRDISRVDKLLVEWENSVSIPSRTPRRDTIENRRKALECLISKIPVYNIDDGIIDEKRTYEYYIKCLTGLDVDIRTAQVPGSGSQFPLVFPFNFGIGSAKGNFVFIIGVPTTGSSANNKFPLPFAVNFFEPTVPQATQDLLNLILDRVIPSFCRWEFEAIIS